jgi:pSer/pThr/pTyr-binding forkhead associated (FHA) protein
MQSGEISFDIGVELEEVEFEGVGEEVDVTDVDSATTQKIWEGFFLHVRPVPVIGEPYDHGFLVPLPGNQGVCLIGRNSVWVDADGTVLVLEDSFVSKNHVTLTWIEEGFYHITDNFSKNGTWLCGRQLLPGRTTRLEPNQRLVVGKTILMVLENPSKTIPLRSVSPL